MQSGAHWQDEWREDIESRIRKLEAWRNFVLGAGTAAVGVVGVFAHAILKAIGVVS